MLPRRSSSIIGRSVFASADTMLLLTPAILGGSLTLLLYTVSQHSVRVVTTTYLRRLAPRDARGQGASVHRTAEKRSSRKLNVGAIRKAARLIGGSLGTSLGLGQRSLRPA